MDYERIEKQFSSQRGGLSPGRLRSMLLCVEKMRKEEAEMESEFSLRSEASAAANDDRGGSSADDCRDVDIVSSVVECSNLMEPPAGGNSHQIMSSCRMISQVDDSFDSESVSSNFDFHKGLRASNGSMLKLPFSKSAPSKWDDAQKWIAGPATVNRPSKGAGPQSKKPEYFGLGSRQTLSKLAMMEDGEDSDTKRIDAIQAEKDAGTQKPTNLVPETCLLADSCAKPGMHAESLSADASIIVSRHDSSASVQSVTAFVSPASTMRSVGMRDMGTEMTPIASQEPSRTSTPVRASSPMRSPTSSRPSSPRRVSESSDIDNLGNMHSDCNREELTERELHIRTRREIMILGTRLGKANIAAWASKEEEEKKEASVSLKTVAVDPPVRSLIEARAAAWEEAEKTKYMARLKREEIKIQAWENHLKAKTEAEMRKVEVEVERMRARAHDRLMSKLAASKHKAEEMRAEAEAHKIKQAAKTAQQAEYIRRTGRIPSSFTCWSWCA